jgi:hypothetical protein
MAVITEQLFFAHIAREIDALIKAYSYVLDRIVKDELLVSATIEDNVEYTVLLRQLNRAIDAFKTEMKESLRDYIYLKQNNISSHYAATHLKDRLNILHEKRDELLKHIPESHLKQGLGHNYYFHKNLKNLTPDTLLDYFEINYTLLLEKDMQK